MACSKFLMRINAVLLKQFDAVFSKWVMSFSNASDIRKLDSMTRKIILHCNRKVKEHWRAVAKPTSETKMFQLLLFLLSILTIEVLVSVNQMEL